MLFSMLGVDSRSSPKARVGFGEKYTFSDWHAAGRTKLVHFDSKKQKFDFLSESKDFELILVYACARSFVRACVPACVRALMRVCVCVLA